MKARFVRTVGLGALVASVAASAEAAPGAALPAAPARPPPAGIVAPKINVQVTRATVNLEVTEFNVEPRSRWSHPNEQFQFKGKMKNKGTTKVDVPYVVALGEESVLLSGTQQQVAPGAEFEFFAAWRAPQTPGTFRFSARVDPNGSYDNSAPASAKTRTWSIRNRDSGVSSVSVGFAGTGVGYVIGLGVEGPNHETIRCGLNGWVPAGYQDQTANRCEEDHRLPNMFPTLRAVAKPGHRFTGWYPGNCDRVLADRPNECVINPGRDRSVTATFAPN